MSTAAGIAATRRVLLGTRNRAADLLLSQVVAGPATPVRWVAVDGLVTRPGTDNRCSLLAAFRGLDPSERHRVHERRRSFIPAMEQAFAGDDVTLCESACRFAVHFSMVEVLPAVARAAAREDQPYAAGLSATVLQLARVLFEQSVDYRQDHSLRDPFFDRRAAVRELDLAVVNFAAQPRQELIEAFLLLTPADNPTLSRIIDDTTHAAHLPLRHALTQSPSPAACELLMRMLEDPSTPQELLELTLSRSDRLFLQHMATHVSLPVPRRIHENLRRVRRIAWVEEQRVALAALPTESQIVLLEMACQSHAPRLHVFESARLILSRGDWAARVKACEVIDRVEVPRSVTVLEENRSHVDPRVAITAAALLFARGVDRVLPQLSAALQHQDPLVAQRARHALRHMTFSRFLSRFDELGATQRADEAAVAAAVDPHCVDLLERELLSATLDRKLRGLELAQLMGLVEMSMEIIAQMAADKDIAIRAAALAALATTTHPTAIAVVEAAEYDTSGLVREAAAEARSEMNGQGVPNSTFEAMRRRMQGDES